MSYVAGRAKLEKRSFSSQGRLLPRHRLHPHACDTGPRTLCAPRIPSTMCRDLGGLCERYSARTRRRHHSPCLHNNSRPAKTCCVALMHRHPHARDLGGLRGRYSARTRRRQHSPCRHNNSRHHSPCRHNNSRPAKTCRAAQSADASSPASRGAQTDHFACLLPASLLQPAQRTWRPATAHLVHSTKLQAAQRMWRPATARLVHSTKLQEQQLNTAKVLWRSPHSSRTWFVSFQHSGFSTVLPSMPPEPPPPRRLLPSVPSPSMLSRPEPPLPPAGFWHLLLPVPPPPPHLLRCSLTRASRPRHRHRHTRRHTRASCRHPCYLARCARRAARAVPSPLRVTVGRSAPPLLLRVPLHAATE